MGGVGDNRGTWPYMAPEMLRSPPEGVSRSSDVYALGTLCWELLTGKKPWAERSESVHLAAVKQGPVSLLHHTSPPLPGGTPPVVVGLLGKCLSADKTLRPRAAQLAEALHQTWQGVASGKFDIFLSHAWVGGKHAPLTTEVYRRLNGADFKVWLDTEDMGHNMVASMEGGIAKSDCVVALLSSNYGTKPDPAKDNCLLELRAANNQNKPIIACLADPSPGWFPSAGGTVAELVKTSTHLMPDLRAAAAVDWDTDATSGEVLTKALPMLLKLVREKRAQNTPAGGAGIAP